MGIFLTPCLRYKYVPASMVTAIFPIIQHLLRHPVEREHFPPVEIKFAACIFNSSTAFQNPLYLSYYGIWCSFIFNTAFLGLSREFCSIMNEWAFWNAVLKINTECHKCEHLLLWFWRVLIALMSVRSLLLPLLGQWNLLIFVKLIIYPANMRFKQSLQKVYAT